MRFQWVLCLCDLGTFVSNLYRLCDLKNLFLCSPVSCFVEIELLCSPVDNSGLQKTYYCLKIKMQSFYFCCFLKIFFNVYIFSKYFFPLEVNVQSKSLHGVWWSLWRFVFLIRIINHLALSVIITVVLYWYGYDRRTWHERTTVGE